MAGNPGLPGTGEVYHFGEGRLILWASASGTTSGSGVGYVSNSTLSFVLAWKNIPRCDLNYRDILTGRRIDLSIEHLYYDRTLNTLFNSTAAINAKFEALQTGAGLGKSAIWQLYSGVIDNNSISQADGRMFGSQFAIHANIWSAFGQ